MKTTQVICYSLAAVLSFSSPALTQETVTGWAIQYRMDTFAGTVVPMGFIQEAEKQVGGSGLLLVCDNAGRLRLGFQEQFAFSAPKPIEFRMKEGTRIVQFSLDEVPVLGSRYLANGDDSMALIEEMKLLEQIAYRTEGAQGKFLTVGLSYSSKIIAAHCNS